NQPVVLNLTDTLYNLQIEHFQTDVILDEGFLMLIQFSFDADCDLSGFFNTHFSSRFSFNEQLPETENPKIFTQHSRSIGTLTPQLSASALLPNISSDERRVRWEFNLRNRAVTGGSISSGPSLNTWIEAISPT